MNVFEAVKENVTARQAAEHYGIRVGRNGMACCPFHDDRNPSLKVDKRFHCFGCQADGDVIDFVARLYGLPGLEAAKKLASDFGISYDSRGRASPKPARRSVSAELRFLQAERKCFRVLSDYLHLLERWETAYAPKSPGDGWNPLFVEAMQKREYVGYLLDTLLTGTKEEKAAVITGHGKEVERIERRVSKFAARGQASVGTAIDSMDGEKTVGEVRQMLETTQKGQTANTPGNYRAVFLHDPLLRGAFSSNLLTDRVDIVKPLGWYRDGNRLTDVDIQYLVLYLEEHYGLTSEKRIEGAIKVAANEYRYHPVRDYLNSLQWDGTERVRYALRHFLGAEVSDYNYEVLLLFMLGAVARVFKPGTKFEVMLCLVGGQGAGKSTFFRFLAVRDEWFSDDLRKLDDDNVYRKLQGHWIIEMSEMIATANAKSIEDIKSFLSRQKETYKAPYEVHPKDHKRQCVFAGTSNTLDFLPLDRTGNRRFLPVQVQAEAAEVHILEDEAASRAYIGQMWAEVMEVYRKGDVKLKLSPAMEKYLKEHQRSFMPEDTLATRILNFLDGYGGKMVCSLQIYHEGLGHPDYEEPKQYDIRDINSIMKNYAAGWKAFENPRHFPPPYNRQKGWERAEPPDNGGHGKSGFQPLPEGEAVQLGLPKEWLEGGKA